MKKVTKMKPPKAGGAKPQGVKKPKQKAQVKGTGWMNQYVEPSKQSFQKYMKAQQAQFNPVINTLSAQLGALQQGDPTVRAYQSMLGALPSNEAVSGSYRAGLENVAKYMQGINLARGGQGVSEALSSIGGALGVEGAGDIAQAAGTVSGIGEAGGDVMSKALMAGAAAQFSGLESERLAQLGEQRQALTLGIGEAQSAARDQRQELARMLAEARGQRREAGIIDPFEMANTVMQYQQNRRALSGGGNGGGSGTVVTTPKKGKKVTITTSKQIQKFITAGSPKKYMTMPNGTKWYGGSIPQSNVKGPKQKLKR